MSFITSNLVIVSQSYRRIDIQFSSRFFVCQFIGSTFAVLAKYKNEKLNAIPDISVLKNAPEHEFRIDIASLFILSYELALRSYLFLRFRGM
jgi:hypothetical protein